MERMLLNLSEKETNEISEKVRKRVWQTENETTSLVTEEKLFRVWNRQVVLEIKLSRIPNPKIILIYPNFINCAGSLTTEQILSISRIDVGALNGENYEIMREIITRLLVVKESLINHTFYGRPIVKLETSQQ